MEVYILNSPLVGPVKFALFDDKSVVAANTSAHMQIALTSSIEVVCRTARMMKALASKVAGAISDTFLFPVNSAPPTQTF
jgi:hypothetical protein